MKNLKIPTSFYVVAAFLLLWNSMGVFAFFHDLALIAEDIALLPIEQQELFTRLPAWTKIFYVLAVFGGFLGCLFLLLKKKIAHKFFQISMFGIIVQIGHSIFGAKSLDVYGPGGLIMPAMIIILGIYILWYSKKCQKKGWLN